MKEGWSKEGVAAAVTGTQVRERVCNLCSVLSQRPTVLYYHYDPLFWIITTTHGCVSQTRRCVSHVPFLGCKVMCHAYAILFVTRQHS